MKVLLSAYACEPDRGSEPGVGWHWALAVARRHEVWVVTRANNRPVIEAWEAAKGSTGIHWIYHDCGPVLRRLKRLPFGVQWYYRHWQNALLPLVRQLHQEVGFDLAHHVTFVSHHVPSHLWRLGIPFVYGPLAGADEVPHQWIFGLSAHDRFCERLHRLVNRLAPTAPGMRGAVRHAALVLAATPAVADYLLRRYNRPISLHAAMSLSDVIGIDPLPMADRRGFVFAGQLRGLKGVWIALLAYRRYLTRYASGDPQSLTVVGDGPDRCRLLTLAERLGLDDRVAFRPWMAQAEWHALAAGAKACVFPSLRDSGGMVPLEAGAVGTPAIVLDLAGPGVFVHDGCNGLAVSAEAVRPAIDGLARAMAMVDGIDPATCVTAVAPYRVATLADDLHRIYVDLVKEGSHG